jgi:hypothetical protein
MDRRRFCKTIAAATIVGLGSKAGWPERVPKQGVLPPLKPPGAAGGQQPLDGSPPANLPASRPPPAWVRASEAGSPELSERVASRALGWIEAHLSHFDPFSQGLAPDEQAQTVLAELAWVCYLLRRRREFAHDPRLDRCLDLVESVYRHPHFHEYAFRGDKRFFDRHLQVWIALSSRGVEKLVSRDQLQKMIDAANVTVVELTPYHSLELRYLLEVGRFRHDLPSEADLFRQTFLGGNPKIVFAMDSDIYSITHTVYYLTDFGARNSPLLSGQERDRTLQLIDLLLGMMIHARQWDLVAELILSHRCLDPTEVPMVRLGWEALLAHQDPEGAIGSSACSPSKLKELPPGKEGKRRLFTSCYHQTLVTVLAGYLGMGGARASG